MVLVEGLKLVILRKRDQKKLYKTNLKIFMKITEYIKKSNLKYYDQEEVLQQIMDIMLQAQAESKSINNIVEDYEGFCKAIVDEYTKDKNFMYLALQRLQKSTIISLCMFAIIQLFCKIFFGKLNMGINILCLISVFGYAFILLPFTKTSKQKAWSTSVYLFVVLGLNNLVGTNSWGETINKLVISSADYIFSILVLIVVVIQLYKWIYDKRSINMHNG